MSHYMEGVFAKRSTKTVEYFHGAHMHRLPCVILAQFFQTSSARTRNTDPKFVYCCKRTCYKSGSLRSLILFRHTNSKTAFFNSVPKCFKSFFRDELSSAACRRDDLRIIWFKKKNKSTNKRLYQKPGACLAENS